MITEENFIDELKIKNEKALEYIFETYGNLIFKIAYMHLNSKELSKEATNETLLKVWNSIEKFNYPPEKFKNWIASIAKYTSIDIYRKESRHSFTELIEETIEDKYSLSDNIINKTTINLIKSNINLFNDTDKYIFINRFFIGKSVSLIAKELNLTPNAVSLRISKGRSKLKKNL